MPGRILVVDDVATNRIILKVKLAGAAYDVLQAGSGAEALKLAQRDMPDLILLDISMPELDGLEVCRRLKADHRTADIPVIMVTAFNDPASKIAALEAGAEDFMTKPLDDLGLLARVRSLIRARGVAAELALREGTRQALGFAEPTSGFVAAGRICLVAADEATALAWRRGLDGKLHDKIEVHSPGEVLKNANGPKLPDLYVIAADLSRSNEGLMLLSELRSRQTTRHAGILIAIDEDARMPATMALDMGASDIITLPFDYDELALRLRAQLARKRQGDRLRSRVRDGLQMAVTDPLTGLYNRRYAMSHLTRVRERAIANDRSFAVMMIDLDHFKQVNDTHGHAAGDEVLKTVAETLSCNLRSVDLVARIGGEEFIAILPDIFPDAALSAAERLREKVCTAPITLPRKNGQATPLTLIQTISVGLVTDGCGPAGTHASLSELLDRADKALYHAKSLGRNRVVIKASGQEAA
ncbi:diguanylate cyclase [Aliiruegeria lutimaris]|uniref:diguanylate cyclase n=1 Tax=Aliiruegeria lutimaris TaxID=571298 RepID=A0A1G8X379_9RHOB|nr:diguanylate cyclase [Aliiruegeria lutimaris]SDJ84904.1 response regulator receiver modulated diguanylate cyclase [Aliiruegeria lutimaris]